MRHEASSVQSTPKDLPTRLACIIIMKVPEIVFEDMFSSLVFRCSCVMLAMCCLVVIVSLVELVIFVMFEVHIFRHRIR